MIAEKIGARPAHSLSLSPNLSMCRLPSAEFICINNNQVTIVWHMEHNTAYR